MNDTLAVAGRDFSAACRWPAVAFSGTLQPSTGSSLPKVVWLVLRAPWHSLLTMRVNIKARIPMHLYQEFHTLPLLLTIETAHGLSARCEHRTTAAELMWTLDQKTDINSGLLDRFRQKLRLIEEAHLSDVEVSDEVLDMFGFFV